MLCASWKRGSKMASFISLTDLVYPVGSYFISNTSNSPASRFGGTWTQMTDSRTLIGASSVYTGGSSSHTHQYGVHICTFWNSMRTAGNSDDGIISVDNYSNGSSYTYVDSTNVGQAGAGGWSTGNLATYRTQQSSSYHASIERASGKASYTSTYPPYRSCYMWYRTA